MPEPKPRRFRFRGRKPIANRKALTAILFVLKTGIPWQALPQEMGCGSGMSCWRRRDWQQAGVWQQLHETLLAHLRHADQLDWSRAIIASSSVRAIHGGEKTGPNPTDRRKAGSKHHVVTDANGVILETSVTAANAHDVTQLEPLLEGVPAVRGRPGRPRHRPEQVYADRAYNAAAYRARLRDRGIAAVTP